MLGGDAPANKVQEVKSDMYGNLQILQRDDSLVLYGPTTTSTDNKKLTYEIVVHRPFTDSVNTSSFSLYRAPSKEDGEEKFLALMHRLPTFVSVVKEWLNVNGLQKVCDILIDNPSWSLGHLVSYFNLTEYILHDSIIEFIDYPDHTNLMTPLQVKFVIKSESFD